MDRPQVEWKGDKPLEPAKGVVYRQSVADLAKECRPKVILELGVYRAELTRLLSIVPGVQEIWAIDHWEPGFAIGVHKMDPVTAKTQMDYLALEVFNWAKTAKNVKVLRMDSTRAVHEFADAYIDFWHTDALHSFEGVTRDIRIWWPKIKDGGMLSGDNYEIPGVNQAVDYLLPHRKLLAKGRVWYARKDGELPEYQYRRCKSCGQHLA